jgi:hypothetical protein
MANPYRAQVVGPVERLRVFPVLNPRFLILSALIAAGPWLVFALLWSRELHLDCTRERDTVTCVTSTSTLVSEGTLKSELKHPRSARTSQVHGSSIDIFIEAKTDDGDVPLTTGFNLDYEGQNKLASQLSSFFQDPDATHFQGSFGERFRVVALPIICAFLGLGLIAMMLTQRLELLFDEVRKRVTIKRSFWPRVHREVELREIQRVTPGVDPRGRQTAYVQLESGEQIALGLVVVESPGKLFSKLNGALTGWKSRVS